MPQMRVAILHHQGQVRRRDQAQVGHTEEGGPDLPQDQIRVQGMRQDLHRPPERRDGREVADAPGEGGDARGAGPRGHLREGRQGPRDVQDRGRQRVRRGLPGGEEEAAAEDPAHRRVQVQHALLQILLPPRRLRGLGIRRRHTLQAEGLPGRILRPHRGKREGEGQGPRHRHVRRIRAPGEDMAPPTPRSSPTASTS